MFKFRLTLLFLLIAAVFLHGCASGPDIRTDHDPNVDFSQYKTYNFFDPLGIDNPGYSTIYGSIFKNALSREMEARGYVKSDDPDLLLNVSARLQDKTKVRTYNDPVPYYGYRRGYDGAWGGYGYNTTTHVDQYTEGTVNVDMVDASAKQMVWEGVAVGRLREDRTNAEVTEAINSAVAAMFESYPFRAGE
jgi:hypothetical protein